MLPEYGRHVHEMVDFLKTVEDRDLRNEQARSVIAVMGNINPILRDSADFTHKLWDHLFIMADFQLDVDSPYPIPTAATLSPKPERLAYPKKRISRRHYGKNIERMIRSLEKESGEENKQAVTEAINNIARYMRTKSFEYNQEHPNNESIIKEIKRMSESGIELDENAINNLKSDYKQHLTVRPKKNMKGQNRPSGKPGSNNNNNNNKQRYQNNRGKS